MLNFSLRCIPLLRSKFKDKFAADLSAQLSGWFQTFTAHSARSVMCQSFLRSAGGLPFHFCTRWCVQRSVRFSPEGNPGSNFLTLKRCLLASVIFSGYPVFPLSRHCYRFCTSGSHPFFLEVSFSCFSLESGNDNFFFLRSLSPNMSPRLKWIGCTLSWGPSH